MTFTRRTFALSAFGGGAMVKTHPVDAQAGPRPRPLTLLVAQPAGGVTDAFARALAPALARELGRAAWVENLPGASGTLAARRLLAAAPDASTLFVGSSSEAVLAPLTLKLAQYRSSDFRLLGVINDSPLALYARSDLPANNFNALIAQARSRGLRKPLSFGSPGQGSLFHLVAHLLMARHGVQALHVPYRGGMPLLNDLQGGFIDFAVLSIDSLLGERVEAGQLKLLAVSAAHQRPPFKDAPTFGWDLSPPAARLPSIWVGLLASARASNTTTALLHQAAARALADLEVRKAVERAGGVIPASRSLAEIDRFYGADDARLRALVKAAKFDAV